MLTTTQAQQNNLEPPIQDNKVNDMKIEIKWEHHEPWVEELKDLKSYQKHHNMHFNYWREEKGYFKTKITKVKNSLLKKNKLIEELKKEKQDIEQAIALLKQSARDIDAEIL